MLTDVPKGDYLINFGGSVGAVRDLFNQDHHVVVPRNKFDGGSPRRLGYYPLSIAIVCYARSAGIWTLTRFVAGTAKYSSEERLLAYNFIFVGFDDFAGLPEAASPLQQCRPDFLFQDFADFRTRQVGPGFNLLRRFYATDEGFHESAELRTGYAIPLT
jgi:hypothetical protein